MNLNHSTYHIFDNFQNIVGRQASYIAILFTQVQVPDFFKGVKQALGHVWNQFLSGYLFSNKYSYAVLGAFLTKFEKLLL